jgi:hypothetical protein
MAYGGPGQLVRLVLRVDLDVDAYELEQRRAEPESAGLTSAHHVEAERENRQDDDARDP